MNNIKLVVAFFNRDCSCSVAKRIIHPWWDFSELVCNDLGVSPIYIGVTMKNKVRGISNENVCNYLRYKSRIQHQLELDNVQNIELFAINDPKGYIAWDYTFTAYVRVEPLRGNVMLVSFDTGLVPTWNRLNAVEFFECCMNIATRHMQVDYGFSMMMPNRWLPAGYALGIGGGNAERRIIRDANAWMDFAERDCHKWLRNAFGWSLLSKEHLAINVDGVTLEEWIQQTPHRGKLIPMSNNLTCWTFEDETENMDFLNWENPSVENVRRQLEQYKIFPWQHLPD